MPTAELQNFPCSGFDFFSNLPEPMQRGVEAGENGNNPPLDTGADGVPDAIDKCPTTPNADQADADNDANYSCADGGAGISSCAGTVPSGTPIDTLDERREDVCGDGDGRRGEHDDPYCDLHLVIRWQGARLTTRR